MPSATSFNKYLHRVSTEREEARDELRNGIGPKYTGNAIAGQLDFSYAKRALLSANAKYSIALKSTQCLLALNLLSNDRSRHF